MSAAVAVNGVLVALALEAPPEYRAALAVAVLVASAAIAWCDVRTLRIADRHTGLLAASGVVQGLVVLGVGGTVLPLLGAVCCVAGAAAAYFVLGLAGIVGLGDVKFAAVLAGLAALVVGCWAPIIPVGALVCACCYQLLLAVFQRRRRPHANGPALAVATALMLAIEIVAVHL